MPFDEENLASIAAVDRIYAGLMTKAAPVLEGEPNLGGNLLYAGELTPANSPLVVGANIAGAATLVATDCKTMQRQAVRDGLIDFLVTTLSEALRILKNQIRKRETVAVCVAAPHEQVAREMEEIGVLPDLLPAAALDLAGYRPFRSQGAQTVSELPLAAEERLMTWTVAVAPALWLPKLDELAKETTPGTGLRWLRLAPRYLGRAEQRIHALRCEASAAERFLERVRDAVKQGAIEGPIEVNVQACERVEYHLIELRTAAMKG